MLVTEPTVFKANGSEWVMIRPLRESESWLLADLFFQLSQDTKRMRFHTVNMPNEQLWKQVITLSKPDPDHQVVLAAIVQREASVEIIGLIHLTRPTAWAEEAEWAIVVRDDYQKGGVGTRLLSKLIRVAHAMGIKRLIAWVMYENITMLRMIQRTGLSVEQYTEYGETMTVIHVEDIATLHDLLVTSSNGNGTGKRIPAPVM